MGGGLEVVVLGSGAFTPARKPSQVRNPAGYAVRLPGGLLLFDLGFGDLWQLARSGLRPAAASDLFLTHRHPDHAGDLAALLFHLRYDEPPRSGRLRLWGPAGLAGFVARLRRAFHPWLEPRGYRLELRVLADGDRACGAGWRVDALRAPHPTPALSYRLRAAGRSVVFSGDTGPNPRLERFAAGCDLLILEATLPAGRREPGHLDAEQALAAARAAAPRLTVFSHLSEGSEADLRRLLRRAPRLPGKVAQDGMRLRYR
ncbi:MAG: ribonuclease Z [Elusimicrobia bacterium]|nr:ribonuclease Z [Elusimicrobiota bacterium]